MSSIADGQQDGWAVERINITVVYFSTYTYQPYSISDLRQIHYTTHPTYQHVVLQLLYGLVAAAPGPLIAYPKPQRSAPQLQIIKVLKYFTFYFLSCQHFIDRTLYRPGNKVPTGGIKFPPYIYCGNTISPLVYTVGIQFPPLYILGEYNFSLCIYCGNTISPLYILGKYNFPPCIYCGNTISPLVYTMGIQFPPLYILGEYNFPSCIYCGNTIPPPV